MDPQGISRTVAQTTDNFIIKRTPLQMGLRFRFRFRFRFRSVLFCSEGSVVLSLIAAHALKPIS